MKRLSIFTRTKSSAALMEKSPDTKPKSFIGTPKKKATVDNEVSKFVAQISANVNDADNALKGMESIIRECDISPEQVQFLADKSVIKVIIEAMNENIAQLVIKARGMEIFTRMFKDNEVRKKAIEAFCEKSTINSFYSLFISHCLDKDLYMHSTECMSEFTRENDHIIKKFKDYFSFSAVPKETTGSKIKNILEYLLHSANSFKDSKEILQNTFRIIYNLMNNNKKKQEDFIRADGFCKIIPLAMGNNDLEYEACRLVNAVASNHDLLAEGCTGRTMILNLVNDVGNSASEQNSIMFCNTLISFAKTSNTDEYKGFSGIKYDALINIMSAFKASKEIQEKCMVLIAILCEKCPDFRSFFLGGDYVKVITGAVQGFQENNVISSNFEKIVGLYAEMEFDESSFSKVMNVVSELSYLKKYTAIEKVYEAILPGFFKDEIKGVVAQNNCVEMLFRILEKYRDSGKIAESILNTLLIIFGDDTPSEKKSENFKAVEGLKNSIEIISSVMSSQKSENIQVLLFKFIYCLVSNKKCLMQIYSSNVIDKISTALKDFGENKEVQAHGIRVLSKCLEDKIIKEKCDKKETVGTVVKALEKFDQNDIIKESSCMYISKIFKNKEAVIKNKGPEALIKLISAKSISDDLFLLGIDAFMNVSFYVKEKNLPDDDCGSLVVTYFMIRNAENESIVIKCFGFLKVIVELRGNVNKDSMWNIMLGVAGVISRCSDKTRDKKTVLDTCEVISQHAPIVTPESLHNFDESFIPVIKLVEDPCSKPQIKSFCCSVLSQVDFSTVSTETLVKLLSGMKLILEKDENNDSLVDACCRVLCNIELLDKEKVGGPLIKSRIHEDLSRILSNRSTVSPSILSALKGFFRFGEEMSSMIWSKVFSQLLIWIKKYQNDEVIQTCFDFIKESLENKLSGVTLEFINFLISIVLKRDNDERIWKAGRLLLPLLLLKRTNDEPILTEESKLLNDINNESKLIDDLTYYSLDFSKEKANPIFVDVLFVVMLYHKNNQNIQIKGLNILRKDFGNKERMKDLHMIEYVVSIMKKHSDNDDILKGGIHALERFVKFLGYGKDEAIKAINSAKKSTKDAKIVCKNGQKDIEKIEMKPQDTGFLETPFKLSDKVFYTEEYIVIDSIKKLRELDSEKVAKFLKQNKISEDEAINNVKKKKIDGEAFLGAKTEKDLADLCGFSSVTSKKIFGIVKEIIANDTKMKITKMRIQAETSSEQETVIIEKYENTTPDFYETLEESLETAEFEDVKTLIKHSREIARLLEKQGVLEDLEITQADAMALTIYTYDFGQERFEANPYRIVNRRLNERSKNEVDNLKGYILRLLAALRKLPTYDGTKTLYRALTNVSDNYKKVGSNLNWPAFTSTSSDENSVIDFFNNIAVDGDRYILEITGCFKKGHSIRDFSFHSDEDEILFEPETRFKVTKVEPDTKVDGVTRIHVEVLDTPNILAEVVENFTKMCEENMDKENFTNELMNSGEKIAPYGGPVVSKGKWHGFWDAVKKVQTRYMGVKEALGFMVGNDALREVFVDGYKTALIDNEYCEGAEMMRGYDISVEEGAALYSYTYKYGEGCSGAVDGMVKGWPENPSIAFDPHGTNYLLHIASALEKLQVLGANEAESEDGDDDDEGSESDEQKGGKRIYLCMKEDAAKALRAGEEYVLGSVFVGCAVRPSAGEGECVVCVEDAQLLCVREVGPLSAWGKGGYLLGLPGAHIAVVTEFEEGDKGKDVVVRGVPVCEEEKGSYSECVKHFTFMIPLPSGWSIETDDDSGRVFYQNNETDEVQWARPVIEDPEFFTDFGPATTPSQNVMSQPAQSGKSDVPQLTHSYYMHTNPSHNPQGNPQQPAPPIEQQYQQQPPSQVVKSSPTANNINTPSPQQNINSPTSPLQKNIIIATPPQNTIAGSSPNTQNFKATPPVAQLPQPALQSSDPYSFPKRTQSFSSFPMHTKSASFSDIPTALTNQPPSNQYSVYSSSPEHSGRPNVSTWEPSANFLKFKRQTSQGASPGLAYVSSSPKTQASPLQKSQFSPPTESQFSYAQRLQRAQSVVINLKQAQKQTYGSPFQNIVCVPSATNSCFFPGTQNGGSQSPRISQLAQQPLPPNWEARIDPKSGRTYYANTLMKTTQWEHPLYVSPQKSVLTNVGNGVNQLSQSYSPQNIQTYSQQQQQQHPQGVNGSLIQPQATPSKFKCDDDCIEKIDITPDLGEIDSLLDMLDQPQSPDNAN